MEWSAITWRSASPSQQEPEHRWHGGEAVGAAGGFVGRQPVTTWNGSPTSLLSIGA
jgi:hypothetical protein